MKTTSMLKSSNILKLVGIAFVLWCLSRLALLDWSVLTHFVSNPAALVSTLIFWLVFPILLGWMRWHIIVESTLGRSIPFLISFRSHCSGQFFNSFLPGAIGGDIGKIGVLKNDLSAQDIVEVSSAAIIDRVLGLIGLIICGIVGLSLVFGVHSYLVLPIFLVSLLSGFLLRWTNRSKRRLEKAGSSSKVFNLWNLLCQILNTSFETVQSKPLASLAVLFISIVCHLGTTIYLAVLATVIFSQNFEFSQMSVAYAGTGLSIAFPILPSGIGVGHVVTESILSFFNRSNGANLFHIFVSGQLTLNLTAALGLLTRTKSTDGSKIHGTKTVSPQSR